VARGGGGEGGGGGAGAGGRAYLAGQGLARRSGCGRRHVGRGNRWLRTCWRLSAAAKPG
jgi:hypothetical protein